MSKEASPRFPIVSLHWHALWNLIIAFSRLFLLGRLRQNVSIGLPMGVLHQLCTSLAQTVLFSYIIAALHCYLAPGLLCAWIVFMILLELYHGW